MNRFLAAHQAADAPAKGSFTPAAETMGYYDRDDLPFYYALADKFTICDGYHCSVIGPTDPNRLMSMSAWMDPAGTHGGPLVETISDPSKRGPRFSWTTMPERLSAHGVSWKLYTDQPGLGNLDNVLTYFDNYANKAGKLYARGIAPTYPADFLADLSSGRLPKVSWLQLGLTATEHPGFSSSGPGEAGARAVVEALVSHPDVWRKTALFLTWDENGGFFDHVAPPTAPAGTAGEFLTVPKLPAAAGGIRGPIGLGFRVPMLVVSPFSRGGLVCSDTVRSHLDAALPRDPVRGQGAKPDALASQGHGRPDQCLQLRRQAQPGAPVPGETRLGDVREVWTGCRVGAALPQAAQGQAAATERDRLRRALTASGAPVVNATAFWS